MPLFTPSPLLIKQRVMITKGDVVARLSCKKKKRKEKGKSAELICVYSTSIFSVFGKRQIDWFGHEDVLRMSTLIRLDHKRFISYYDASI